MYLVGGLPWLVWGFCVPTVTLAHATFAINTVNHMFGSRRFETLDGSRNNWLTAVFAVGEGWHNNHHRYQRAARNGFYWWEFDPTWYVIRAMASVGLAWDVQSVPARVYAEARAGSPAVGAYVMIGRGSSPAAVALDRERDGGVPDPRLRETAAHRSASA
jgi:stearoyl-CoA desaturase (delta-9 desaturase)